MKKIINIPTEIEDIVTAMTQPIAITSISESGGVSTITTDSIRLFDEPVNAIWFDLQDGMIVTINSINYQVSNVTHTPITNTFEITATGLVATEWNIAANYKPASRYEVNQILNQESGNLNRFPLIWLLPTTELDENQQVLDFTASLTLVFAHKSNKTDRTATRYTNNFEPVIKPLITLFNYWLTSTDFNYMLEYNGQGKPIDSQSSDYAFYGTTDKAKEVLNTTTDAVEMVYNLKFKKQYEY